MLRRVARRQVRAATLLGCLAVAVASLVVPATLGYDPWAWLVWGREVPAFALDTTGGPSWKPLPVAVTTVLAALGDLAVPAYLVVARAASLLAVVAVVRLGARLGGRLAGAVAAAALLVVPDGDPRFLRLVLEGHEAPWSMGLAVVALHASVDGRRRRALLALWLLSLLRPEAWPFLLAHVAWLAAPTTLGRARRSVRSWPWAAPRDRSSSELRWAWAALASVPLLWFVPDWIGSGSPLHGGRAAQVLADEPASSRLLDSLATFAGMVPVPVWVLAAVAVAVGVRRADPVPARLAVAAGAWSALVVAMAAIGGYAAISRFFLPPAAVLCVLAGVGAVHAGAALRRTSRPWAAAAVLVVLASALVAPRALGIADVVDEVAGRGELEEDLDRTIELAGGRERLVRCDEVAVTGSTLLRSSVAWKLELPLHRVQLRLPDGTGTMLVRTGRAERRALALAGAEEIARGERWVAVAVRCPDGAGR